MYDAITKFEFEDPAKFGEITPSEQRAFLVAYRDRRQADKAYHQALSEELRKRSHLSDVDAELYDLALSAKSIDELTHLDLVTIARQRRAPLVQADSFFRSIVVRRRKRQLGPIPEKHIGISKVKDQLFAESVGMRTPRVLYSGTFEGIPGHVRTNTMLKPQVSSGSKGAFYVFDASNIYSIQYKKALGSWDELSQSVRKQFGEDALNEREWLVQELILEVGDRPARDMKFYAFYGQIGLIQEVDRYGAMQYEFFNEDFTVAVCGRDHEPRFTDPADTVTDKGGLSDAKLETVRRASLEIPAPFMRLDFLNGVTELVFTECSGAPGMSNSLNNEYDELLGRYYHEAEVRLENDLLDGKRFDGYRRFISRLGGAPSSVPDAAVPASVASLSRNLRKWARRARQLARRISNSARGTQV
jgi:hypothetical protein